MLKDLVIGWEEIGGVFLTNVAMKHPFILLGRHGVSKTTCAKAISKIYSEDGFRFYDATKDDLISIAGIPIPHELASGNLKFSRHTRSIWDAKVIVVDELTRANKENQNLWLEILEEHTCFGMELGYETFIATMNPDTYSSTFKLDEALFDRFYSVISVPELQKASSDTLKQIIDLNISKDKTGNGFHHLRECMDGIRKSYSELTEDNDFCNLVRDFVSEYLDSLMKQNEKYLSPRKVIHFYKEILGLSAYYKNSGSPTFLKQAVHDAVKHTISIPLGIDFGLCKKLLVVFESMLNAGKMSRHDSLVIDSLKYKENKDKLDWLEKNKNEFYSVFDNTEQVKYISQLNQDIDKNDISRLYKLTKELKSDELNNKILGSYIDNRIFRCWKKIFEGFHEQAIGSSEQFERNKRFFTALDRNPELKEVLIDLYEENNKKEEFNFDRLVDLFLNKQEEKIDGKE